MSHEPRDKPREDTEHIKKSKQWYCTIGIKYFYSYLIINS